MYGIWMGSWTPVYKQLTWITYHNHTYPSFIWLGVLSKSSFGATAHPAGTCLWQMWHHIWVTQWHHCENGNLGNGSQTDGHIWVTLWHHRTRCHIRVTWLTSPLRRWPWQQNADVSTRLCSHAPWPCIQGCTVEELNLCAIQRWHYC